MWDLVLVFLATFLAAVWWSSRDKRNLPPSPAPALPLVGHLYLLPTDPTPVIEKWRQKCGNLYMVKFGTQPAVLVHEYRYLHEALVKNHDSFMDRNENFVTKTLLNNKGIFSLSGNEWREHRAFVHSTLRDLGMGRNVMAERVQEEVGHFLQSIQDTQGEPTDFSNLISATICNIICGVTIGKRFSHTDSQFLDLLSSLQFLFKETGTSAAVQFFPFLKYFPGDYFRYHELIRRSKHMKSVVAEMINIPERKKNVNVNEESFQDLAQAFLTEIEKKKLAGVTSTSIDEENLVATIWNFFNAGTETTSKSIIFGVLHLLNFPDVQDKIFQEINTKIGTNRSPQISDKSQLKYLIAFILESMRYARLGLFGPDRVANRDVSLGGYLIPKGTILIPVYETIVTSKEVWGDPEIFRPDRFLHETRKDFTPFSLGKRNCVGESLAVMELFLVFASMIQKFQLLPERPGQPPSLETTYGFTRSPLPFTVRAVLRTTSSVSLD